MKLPSSWGFFGCDNCCKAVVTLRTLQCCLNNYLTSSPSTLSCFGSPWQFYLQEAALPEATTPRKAKESWGAPKSSAEKDFGATQVNKPSPSWKQKVFEAGCLQLNFDGWVDSVMGEVWAQRSWSGRCENAATSQAGWAGCLQGDLDSDRFFFSILAELKALKATGVATGTSSRASPLSLCSPPGRYLQWDIIASLYRAIFWSTQKKVTGSSLKLVAQ